jgi:glycosyltransferase involved in cell wall biosynthesis
MLTGAAVVATSVGGVPEVVTSGVNGMLVRAGDEAALAAAIETLARSPELRARLAGARARRSSAATPKRSISHRCRRCISSWPECRADVGGVRLQPDFARSA